MFGSDQFLFSGAAAGGFYPTTIDQSLRFEDGDDASLTRTPSVAGNQKTWTWSGWVKRGNLGTLQSIFIRDGNSDSTFFSIRFNTSNNLEISQWNSRFRTTSAVFRDPSAWYHLVVAFDTTEATASDRVKLWINGTEETNFSTTNNPTLNADYGVNSTAQHCFGRDVRQSNFEYDGYLAEVHFTDGTAYDADTFGELKSGIWVPKSPSVTYGTNGFYLAFGDSAAIGDDTSGEGNDWTVNNLVASDVVLDSPTNNFAVCNALEKGTSITLAEGNLKVTNGANQSWQATASTVSVSSGKWYCEVRINVANQVALGIAQSSLNVQRTPAIWETAQGYSYFDTTGDVRHNNASTSYGGATYTAGDIISIALDLDAGTLVFYKNGVSQGTAATGLTGEWKFVFAYYTTNNSGTSNFGQDSTFAGNETAGGNSDDNGIGDFQYAPPSGYLALCTANLPDPVIDPAQDATPEDYFNVITFNGDSTGQSNSSLTFQPDFVWFKERSENRNNKLFDVIRGATKTLISDATIAELTEAQTLLSFDSNGWTVGTDTGTGGRNDQTYVAWNWKANGSGVSNTDGTITSTVSANTDAGFSVVTYDGEASNTTTVGHGLSSAPEMIIVKDLTDGSPWQIYHETLGNTKNLSLDTSAAESSTYDVWNSTSPTTSVFTVSYVSGGWGAVNYPSRSYVAYCFHSVDGFSKVGSYIGNGSADGPFVYTGFRPAFVMYKRTNSTSNWTILDKSREGYNVDNDPLYANGFSAEGTTDLADLVSNGFKLRTTDASVNASGGAYIYLAFAEQPFKFSNSR